MTVTEIHTPKGVSSGRLPGVLQLDAFGQERLADAVGFGEIAAAAGCLARFDLLRDLLVQDLGLGAQDVEYAVDFFEEIDGGLGIASGKRFLAVFLVREADEIENDGKSGRCV